MAQTENLHQFRILGAESNKAVVELFKSKKLEISKYLDQVTEAEINRFLNGKSVEFSIVGKWEYSTRDLKKITEQCNCTAIVRVTLEDGYKYKTIIDEGIVLK